ATSARTPTRVITRFIEPPRLECIATHAPTTSTYPFRHGSRAWAGAACPPSRAPTRRVCRPLRRCARRGADLGAHRQPRPPACRRHVRKIERRETGGGGQGFCDVTRWPVVGTPTSTKELDTDWQ